MIYIHLYSRHDSHIDVYYTFLHKTCDLSGVYRCYFNNFMLSGTGDSYNLKINKITHYIFCYKCYDADSESRHSKELERASTHWSAGQQHKGVKCPVTKQVLTLTTVYFDSMSIQPPCILPFDSLSRSTPPPQTSINKSRIKNREAAERI